MKRLLFAAALLAGVPARAAQTRPKQAPAVLAVFGEDARLQTKVNLAEKTRPLSEVLSEVSRQTKVKLTALRPAADEKATLFITERPAAEVLTTLGRLFDYQWRKTGGGFELSQDLVSQRREAALRDGELRAHVAAIQARLRALMPLAGTPREQLRARSDQIRATLGSREAPPEQRARATAELSLLQDLMRPGAGAALRILGSLPPAQLDRLWAGGELRLSTSDGTLPKPLADLVHEAGRDLGGSVLVFGGGGGAPEAPLDPPTGAQVTMTLSTGGPVRAVGRGGRMPSLQVVMESLGAGPPARPGAPLRAPRRLPVIWTPMVQPDAAAGERPAKPADPELQRTVTLKPDPAKPRSDPDALLPPGMSANRVPLAEILEKLHTASGLDIVSDAYVRARLGPAQFAGEQTVQQALARIAGALQYDWERRGTLLLLKSERWYSDRPEEVPDRILRPWQARVARTKVPTLDDMADLASRLSDFQTYSLEEYWSAYLEEPAIPSPQGPGRIHEARHHLRFWASLTAPQKAQARAEVIPVARMSRIQARAFTTALTAPQAGRWTPGPAEQGAAPAEIAAGGFSLRVTQVQQQAYGGTDGDGRQFRLMTVQPPGAPGPAGVPPRIGNGDLAIQPVGPPQTLDSYAFNYFLRGESVPSRVANINLPLR